jgi:FkbM family methyltransferase
MPSGNFLWRIHRTVWWFGMETGVHRLPFLGPLSGRLFAWAQKVLFATPDSATYANVKGFRIRLPAEDSSQSKLEIIHGDYERGTTKLFETLLHQGMTVVDAGAHVGYYTLLAARLVGPKGRVYAFEPHPKNYALLKENLAFNGVTQVSAHEKAVSNRASRKELFLGGDSLTHSLYQDAEAQASVSVETVALDDFFLLEGWPPVDLIKIDVEGAEKEVLDGMRQLSRRNAGLKLVVEFGPGCLSRAGVDPQDLFAILEELGFTRFSLVTNRRHSLKIPADISGLLRWGGNMFAEKD